MPKAKRRKLEEFEQRLQEVERQNQKRPWSLPSIGGIGAVLLSVAIAATPSATTAFFSDKENACSVQYTAIAKAVKDGVDDPENLEALAEPGCDVPPSDVVADLAD